MGLREDFESVRGVHTGGSGRGRVDLLGLD